MLGVVLLVARRWRLLAASGVVAAHLFFYGAFALGGAAWLVAPALAVAAFIALERPGERVARVAARYQVAAVFYVSAVAALLFIVDNGARTLAPWPAWRGLQPPFYPVFTGAVAAQLALAQLARGRAPVESILLSLALVVPLALWARGAGDAAGFRTAALTGALAPAVYLSARRWLAAGHSRLGDLRLQAASVALASFGVLVLTLGGG